jgi:hypothetical protein
VFGELYVKEDALTYKPPAGDERKIHAIVRLVYSIDGSEGKKVANASAQAPTSIATIASASSTQPGT